ncbi:MAG: sulfite exporter TauE/SafE family protein [Deltaproteobacteria bacterium]|nr:sulfite exporter TauE/SafE family protein [Deltaproteobacteria bacterium]
MNSVNGSKKYALLFVGFLGGFLSAMLGIGGGVVFVPALLIMGYEKRALGTSLAAIVPSALIGVLAHYIIEGENIQFITAAITIFGSILGAELGAQIVKKVNIKFLKYLILLFLILAGARYIGIIPGSSHPITELPHSFLILLGIIAGMSSTIFGIGGGVIMVPGFNILFGLSLQEAIPTSLAVILPTTIAGTLFHRFFDNISTEAIKYLIPAAFFGAVAGAFVTNSIPSSSLRMIFGGLLIFGVAFSFLRKKPGINK